ncbi:hypothetical protein AB9F45_38175, partial [Rhizobium leguminosarum]
MRVLAKSSENSQQIDEGKDADPDDVEEKPEFYLTEDHHTENSTNLGFWLYLMSDCLIFAVLFA